MADASGLYARLAADRARAEDATRRLARRGNNPYMAGPEPERRTYSDPTADEAIGNVDRERRGGREPGLRSGW